MNMLVNALKADMNAVTLKPGELYIGEEPTLVHTLLGSCLAITLYSRRLNIGAVCHALLPEQGGLTEGREAVDARGGKPLSGDAFRYVDSSMRYMLERLNALGAATAEIDVKVFGGADMFDVQGYDTVGRQNIKKAYRLIEARHLNLVVSDVGGVEGRNLFFYTHTGEVLLKHIRRRTENSYDTYLHRLYENYRK